MKFEDIKKRMDSFFESPEAQFFTKDELEVLKESFGLISSDVTRLFGGEQLEHNTDNNDKYLVVIDSLIICSQKSLEAPMPDKFVEVLASYAELVYNWNENVLSDSVVKQLCLHISRLCEARNIIMGSVEIMKRVDNRFALLNNWSPPVYEISKAYFEELLKENEKEKV
jgi:Mg2+ and Co2+ transporter CorA